MLAWTIYISFAGALVLALLPKGNAALARWFALAVAVTGFAIAIAGFAARCGAGTRGAGRCAVGGVDGHSLHAGRGRDQPRAGAADGIGGGGGRSVQLEYRAADERVLCIFPGADRRRVRRVSQLRSVPAVCVLRDRDCAEVLSDRDLGIDAARVCGDEAGALFVCRARRWC